MSRLIAALAMCLMVGCDQSPEALDASPADATTEGDGSEADAASRDSQVEIDSAPPPPAPSYTLIESDEGALELKRGDEVLARLLAVEVAALPEGAEDKPNYFYDPHTEPHRVEWVPFEGQIEIERLGVGRYHARVAVDREDGVGLRLVFEAPEGEAYYGLGEVFDSVNHRGKRRAMHFEVVFDVESRNNEAHVPIPLLIGTQGWGIFVSSYLPGDFDVAASDPGQIRIAFETQELDFFLYGAATPREVLTHYVDQTGLPAVPAEWAFGGHLWRNENQDQAEFLADAHAIREHDLGMSAMWIDRPWQTDFNSFVMDEARFDDPEALVDELGLLGFELVFWSSPYLHPDFEEIYPTATDEGWLVRKPEGWPRPFDADLVDFTHPDAAAAWQDLVGRAIDLGAKGFKLDYGEDIQVGVGGLATEFGFKNGADQRTMHHQYALYYHRPYVASLAEFILSRAGAFGDQTLTTTIWPGDLQNGFGRHGEDGLVGGLPAAVIGGLSLSCSGYPFYASDVGGFRDGRPVKEVMLRWAAYAAFGTVMQTGGGGKNHNPWDFTPYENGHGETSQFDEQTLTIFRQWSRLHLQLHAYRHPFNQRAHATGIPVTAPLGLVYPGGGEHPDFVFMLGDDLLIAPVVDALGVSEVILPEGTWYDWWTGEAVFGPTHLRQEVPLDRSPVYVRAGAIVPLLDPDIDTLARARSPEVRSYANDPGRLVVRLYPGGPNRRRFETLGDTSIVVEGSTVTLAGDHFTGYLIEEHGRPDGVLRHELEAGPQSIELP